MICNCTYIEEELKTYLQCRSAQTVRTSYPGIIYQPIYTERQTAVARGKNTTGVSFLQIGQSSTPEKKVAHFEAKILRHRPAVSSVA